MPSFPETSVNGMAVYHTPGGLQPPWKVIGSGLDWAITSAPSGRIDASGCLTINAKLAEVLLDLETPTSKRPVWRGFQREAILHSHNISAIADYSGDGNITHAVVIGKIQQYSLPATAARADRRAIALMLLLQDSISFRRRGFAVVEPDFTEHWRSTEVQIG